MDSGKPFSEVALEVRNATKGKRGSFHTIEKYLQGILPNKNNQDEKKRSVYNYLSSLMQDLLTPELFNEALKEIKFSSEEREKTGKGIGRTFYENLVSMKTEVDSGKYETIKDSEYVNSDTLQSKKDWTIKELNYRIKGIDFKKNEIIEEFHSEQISKINLALKELESSLGEIKFNSIGYNKVRENINVLTEEMNAMRDYVNGKWSSIEKGLVEKRDELKKPWYKKI